MVHYKMKTLSFVIGLLFILNRPIFGQLDWAQRTVESTMIRNTPSTLGGWHYQPGFYLFGQYRIWKLTGENSYFQYIKDWVDLHVDSQGNIGANINSLDNSQPGLVTLLCYIETGEEKYKLAADYIRNVYKTYPRTSDGGFLHNMDFVGELWADGVYMILPFLVRYGQTFGDTALYTEAANQIITYASHLQDTSGLLFHAYDEDGSSSWADPVTHHSPWFWGRAMGWFGMAIVEILDIIPEDHPKCSELITILSNLIDGLSGVQDEDSGLWYQVVDQGHQPDNWLESSCSCMYSYVTAKAVEKGYVDSTYLNMAVKTYEGILRDKIIVGSDSLVNLHDISEGTWVSDQYSFYINRRKSTNDLHGLGAFLMMCWQMTKLDLIGDQNSPPVVRITSPKDSSYFLPGMNIPIVVNSYDIDGDVTRVEFYEGGNLLSTDNEPPWSMTWTQVPEGDYLITARAQDDSNATTVSAPVHVFVTDSLFYYEAENGTISAGTVDSNHLGFTGTGFVNLDNITGTYLELTLPIPKSGVWEIRFRDANGSANNRPCEIQVDGSVVDDGLDFPSTGAWENWQYSGPVTSTLESDNHIMRITGNTSESAPNIDHLRLLFLGTENGIVPRPPSNLRLEELNQNSPNPFNPETMISFSLGKSGHVSLNVYNLSGQIVATLINQRLQKGEYRITFDGQTLNSGIYFYRLKTDEFTETKKMILCQ